MPLQGIVHTAARGEDEVIGTITIGPDGKVVIVPERLSRIAHIRPGLPGQTVPTPDSGAEWLLALANWLRPPGVWIVLQND